MKMFGFLFSGSGIVFIILSVGLFVTGLPTDIQLGMVWNIFLFFFDCMWLLWTGIFLISSSRTMLKVGSGLQKRVLTCGYLIVFTAIFLVATLLFNSLCQPAFISNGRIFTFCLQSVPRLLQPGATWDFFIPLGSILLFLGSSALLRSKMSRKGF